MVLQSSQMLMAKRKKTMRGLQATSYFLYVIIIAAFRVAIAQTQNAEVDGILNHYCRLMHIGLRNQVHILCNHAT